MLQTSQSWVTPDPAALELEAAQAADQLQGRSASEVLTWAAERFAPRLTFATGFGAEGCVIIDLIARHHLPIDLFTLDTGLLFPETYELWRRLEARYNVKIRAVRPVQSVEAQAAAHGPRLWERDPDLCCDLRKTRPMQMALAGFDAWITGIRRDQTADRAHARVTEWDARLGLVKVNPLLTWTSDDVWRHVRMHDVPTNPLYSEGYSSIGCYPCTTPVAPGEDPRAGRWRGRGKTECGLHARVIKVTPAASPAETPAVTDNIALGA
jgi:phosphoadenylyl-sulfate reductase (thioredoxin)